MLESLHQEEGKILLSHLSFIEIVHNPSFRPPSIPLFMIMVAHTTLFLSEELIFLQNKWGKWTSQFYHISYHPEITCLIECQKSLLKTAMTIKDSVMGPGGRILVSLGCCHTGWQINFKHYFHPINNEWSSFFQTQHKRIGTKEWKRMGGVYHYCF